MAIHPELLEILACPVCKTPVEVVKNGDGLRCGQCRRVYPVLKDDTPGGEFDIPVMLPEEATDRCPTMPSSARCAAWTSAATK